MRVNLVIGVCLALVGGGLCLVGCQKAKGPAPPDPHSAEGVLHQLQQQGRLLNDALARKDFAYIHDYAYYFTGLAQALFTKLNDEQKQRLRPAVEQLVSLSQQLDNSAGRRHAEATEATLQRLQAVLKDVDQQLQGTKQGG